MASMTAASMATPAGSEWNRPRRATSLLIAPGPDDAWLPENAGPQRKQPRGGLIPEGDVFASDVNNRLTTGNPAYSIPAYCSAGKGRTISGSVWAIKRNGLKAVDSDDCHNAMS